MKSYSYDKWLVLIDGSNLTVHNRITKVIHTECVLDEIPKEIASILCTKDFLILNHTKGVTVIDLETHTGYSIGSGYYSKEDMVNMCLLDDSRLGIKSDNEIDIYMLPGLEYIVTQVIPAPATIIKSNRINMQHGINRELSQWVSYRELSGGDVAINLSKSYIKYTRSRNWYIMYSEPEIYILTILGDMVHLLVYNTDNFKTLLLTGSGMEASTSSGDTIYTYNGVNFVIAGTPDNTIKTGYLTK